VRAKISLSVVAVRFNNKVGATIGLGMGTVLFVETRHVLAGTMTLGELVLVVGYLQQLYDPLKTASKKVGSLQSSLASAERVYSLLDEAPDFVDPPGARPLVRAAGAVAFRNVSFAYEPAHGVLDDVSFEVAPGTRLGIAGTTGAGKTTLVSLLTRFYDPTSGQILLDGVDLREYRLADLRNQFAIVLQEPVLFSTTIAENIAYARPGAEDADVVAAAQAADAHDFICALPEGYGTPVGEHGVRLSGGERQRIALARAFLKDAPILILDEPTSSVDVRTEAQILQAMERLMTGRTAFMIAHRASTLEICDARLDLEHGRVVATTARDATGARRRRRKRIPSSRSARAATRSSSSERSTKACSPGCRRPHSATSGSSATRTTSSHGSSSRTPATIRARLHAMDHWPRAGSARCTAQPPSSTSGRPCPSAARATTSSTYAPAKRGSSTTSTTLGSLSATRAPCEHSSRPAS